jgi:uncharacterized integral membrane protein
MDLGDKIKLGALAVALVLLVLFFALNFEKVEVDLLVVQPELPLAFALVLAALLGLVLGVLRPRGRRR